MLWCQYVTGGTSGVQPPSFDAANGRQLNNTTFAQPFTPPKLAVPPRYGVTVVSTPPPTVRLYVSNVANRSSVEDNDDEELQGNQNKPASAQTKLNSVSPEILSSPSSDPISSGGSVPAGSGSAGADAGARLKSRTGGNVNNPSQSKSSQPNDRKLSASGGDSGNATTTSGTRPEVVTTTATDVTWLRDRQGMSGPLPFPPLDITFDDNEDSDAGAGGGVSSCDSFHQSTETVVMRDAAAAARKAAAAVRRKSVYYNATPEPTTATSASSDADLVTLPRIKQRHHHHHHHHQRHHHSPRAAGDPDVGKVTSLDRGAGTSSKRHVSRTESVGGTGRRKKLAQVDVTGLEMTSAPNVGSSQQQRNPAACRVTRSTVHSDSRVCAAPVNSTATVRFQTPDTVRLHASNPGSGGRREDSATASVKRQASSSTSTTSATSTTRTYGPACVTVTPLTRVDECAKFPVSIATTRERSRPLDPAELLRSEYEASFGGEVNPLILYSTGGGATGVIEQEVNLSEQTVYDNVQYFNM